MDRADVDSDALYGSSRTMMIAVAIMAFLVAAIGGAGFRWSVARA
jgi:hypothetical protein